MIKLETVQFINISSTGSGAAIYSVNGDMTIALSNFNNKTSLKGNGGAIYLDCTMKNNHKGNHYSYLFFRLQQFYNYVKFY